VTCDVADEAIESLLREWAPRLGLTIRYVRRPRQSEGRLAQVRNNAVRALLEDGYDHGRLLFLDGDTYACRDFVARHLAFGRRAEMVIGDRINLTEEQTSALDPRALLAGEQAIDPTPAQFADLRREHRRREIHRLLRRFGLTKSHKPKILGGHFSVSLAGYRRVNGNDEAYHGWGSEDDDFARRVYATGGSSVTAITDIPVMHLYHPTRSPGNWHSHPNVQRFLRRDLPNFCTYGLDNPWPQEAFRVDVLTP